MIWSGDLVDVEHFAEGGEQLYIRLADSELGQVISLPFVCSQILLIS